MEPWRYYLNKFERLRGLYYDFMVAQAHEDEPVFEILATQYRRRLYQVQATRYIFEIENTRN